MKRLLFLIGGLWTLLITTPAGAFDYIRTIEVQNSHTESLSDYQLQVVFNSASLITEGKMKDDCSDLRFVDSDQQTVIPHFLESGCNGASTSVWVKIPSLPANTLSLIFMIYGDPTAVSTSNEEAAFDFYDHFDGDALDFDKWTIERNDGMTWYVANSRLYVRAIRTKKYDRFIINSNYKFNRSVLIEFGHYREANIAAQMGHLIDAWRMYVASPTGADWTLQTWYWTMFETYIHDPVNGNHSAAGCNTRFGYPACYPTVVTESFLPVGNGWADADGNRYGPRAETLGISAMDGYGDMVYYQTMFWIDWIRVRAYTEHVPSYYIAVSDGKYEGQPIYPDPNNCQAKYDQGFANGVASISGELLSCAADLSNAQDEINNLNTEISGLNGQITDLNNQITGLNNQITSLTGELQQCQADLSAKEAALQQCQADLADLQAQLDNANNALSALAAKLQNALPGNNQTVTIPGATVAEQIEALMGAIEKMPAGQIKQLIKDL